MPKAPRFSVIIPTYGRPRFLEEAVGSALAQTVEDLEVVVVDDASPEPVGLPDEARVRVVRRDNNGGPAAARNTGIDQSNGTYLVFCDDDDLMTPDRLEIALEGLARAPVSVCWNRYHDAPDPAGKPLLEGDVRDVILDHMAPHVGRTALERSIVPTFDERFDALEDVEWWLRLATRAQVATVPKVGYLVRRHGGERHRTGIEARVEARQRLLEMYAEYFRDHPHAEAFQQLRLGLTALDAGDLELARRAFARSFRLKRDPKTLWHLARAARLPRGTG
ncbi:MAG: glycosyltransferase family 2 protein [Actinobacteria bacterium]|nr:glycosyltransferase family 2 protein [Actinomycetota bacterium]